MIKLSSLLKEKVSNDKVICDNCNWTWDISDGGKHPYTCHKCGNDNTPIKEVEVRQGHENDRDMVTGVAEIIRMVDDMNNRKEIAEAMLRKFKSEDVIHNAKEFLTLCGI
ncbi:MAG: hypothetical protein RL621_1920 [Bacteroidota bacterium]|jgi:hypothetical protein